MAIPILDAEGLERVLAQAAEERWTTLALIGPNVRGDWGEQEARFDVQRTFRLAETGIAEPLITRFARSLRDVTKLALVSLCLGADCAEVIGKELTGLEALDLSDNDVGDAGAQAIARMLTRLVTLNLTKNNIGVAGAKAIARLNRLTTLSLQNNRIGSGGVRAIASALGGLTTLNLRDNSIGDLGAQLIAERLTNLRTLNLGSNYVGDDGAHSIAKHLTVLTTLDLGNNLVSGDGAEAIGRCLVNLTTLNVWRNQVGESGAARLLDALVSAPRQLQTLDLTGNSIDRLPAEMLSSRDAGAILGYWREYRQGRRHNEVKVLILGQGDTGKTHLRKRLFEDTPQFYLATHRETHNVATAQTRLTVELESTVDVALRVWDFGGQNNLHAAHRFFMTEQRCCYLLVLDATRGATQNRMRTWLRMIRHHAGTRAPLLIVLSKCDVASAKAADALGTVAEQTARALELNLIAGVHRIGWAPPATAADYAGAERRFAAHEASLQAVRDSLADALSRVVGLREQKFGKPFFDIKAWVEGRFNGAMATGNSGKPSLLKSLDRAEYLQQCGAAEMKPELCEATLDILRALGMVHFFNEPDRAAGLAAIRDTIFNPAWVKGPVYTLIRAHAHADHGVVRRDALPQAMDPDAPHAGRPEEKADELWCKLPFDEGDRRSITALMRAGELAFSVSRRGEATDDLLVPDLLESCGAAVPAPWVAASGMVSFDFLPESVLLRLIGRWSDRLVDANSCWRNQVSFFCPDRRLRAMIHADTEQCAMSVSIWEQPADEDVSQARRPDVAAVAHFYQTIVDQVREISHAGGLKEQTVSATPLKTAYHAQPWEKIVAVVMACVVVGTVLLLVVRNQPFADGNLVVLIRMLLSLALAALGATIPGFLRVDWKLKGFMIRAGGALALFVITYFGTPKVLPITTAVPTASAPAAVSSPGFP